MDDELKRLLEAVERSVGHKMSTPRDFEDLSRKLSDRVNASISTSTLKRIWGYVSNRFNPTDYTLTALARFVGYGSWEDFKVRRPEGRAPSDRILTDRVNVQADLIVGDRLRLAWAPDRVCVVRYLGGLRFEVEQSQATRLQPGDTFECGLLIDGEPLYLDNLCQPGCAPSAYVCGQVAGIRYELLETKITEHI